MGRTPGSGLGGQLLEWWSSGRVEMFQLGSAFDSCKKVRIKRPLDGGLSVFHGREAWISEERVSVAERVERVEGELPAKVKESLRNLFAAKVAHSGRA
ncbi:hypothetical protein B296_00015928 [Ensete ventricosum]|uniref:Uncharacterized protein n=1 Tax=Ensete ventricosum TaxID=4639 RepID=A0A426XYW4_ENSVE|nr:hypothetical protein B296_00015928 [Ensete ventricosum]